METQNRIEEILNSTNGMTKVVPDEMLFSKILYKINQQKKLPAAYLWLAAASFALLLSVNVKIVFSKGSSSNNSTESLAETMARTNQLY